MSRGGDPIPELGKMLREIAEMIEAGTAGEKQSMILRRIAESAEGKTGDFVLKLHGRHGHPKGGVAGVNRRVAMARAVKDHISQHGGTLKAAYDNLSGKSEFNNSGADTLEDAWQEMGSMLDMDNASQQLWLRLAHLEARGMVKIHRVKRK